MNDDTTPTPPGINPSEISAEIMEAVDPYYEPYFCDQILLMAEDMRFPEEWADEIGVNEMTMLGWIQKFPAFEQAYYSAMTKLRSAFTRELVDVARGRVPDANGMVYTLLAKKRFSDLYGDAPPQIIHLPYPQTHDTTPGNTIDGHVIDDMTADDLQKELEVLRDRHGLR